MSALSSRGILQRLMTTVAAPSSRDNAHKEHAARVRRLKSDGHIIIVYAGIGKTVSICMERDLELFPITAPVVVDDDRWELTADTVRMERRPEPPRIAAPALVGDETQEAATK